MTRFARWTALVAAALLVAGCGGSSGNGKDEGKNSDPPSATTPSSGAASALPASLTSQKPDWGRCKGTSGAAAQGGGWQCATLKVPLDYAKPGGETIGLALIRSKATGGQGKHLGSLLFNFGGPGGSGVSTMPNYESLVGPLHERYDLVRPGELGPAWGGRQRGCALPR